MAFRVAAYQHGIYPRSEDVVAATRGLERGRVTPEEVAEAYGADREDFVSHQQRAGLDYFSDGLLRWQDLFRPLVEASQGLEARTLIRWFDNNSFFRAPGPAAEISMYVPLPPEYEDGAGLPGPRVATLPSPYLFSRVAQADGDPNALMMELTREILQPVARALADQGYAVVHLQEPWLTYFGIDQADWDDFEKALADIRNAVDGRAALILHTYYGDAAPHIERMWRLPVDAVGIDFVETDLGTLGSHWEVGLLAGCLDGRSSPIESVDGTVAFALRVAETVQPSSLFLSSNSDLELLPRDIARQKVLRLGEVSARVKEALA